MIERETVGAEYFRGGILADEMGLGKTWMTIGLLLNSTMSTTLLLVPPVLQPQWSEALVRSGISHRILSPAKKGVAGIWREFPGTSTISVTLATYDRAFTKVAFLTEQTVYDRIVCDEGHVLRNGAKIKRFREIAKIPAASKWILSGTPIQNKISDFHNLLHFLGIDPAIRIKAVLTKLSETVILRRTVSDVRELVPMMPTTKPIHVIHPVTMPKGSEEENVFYALVRRLEHAIEVHARHMIVLELYLRIRQFVAHPAIYVESLRKSYKGLYKREAWNGTASKVAEFDTFLDNAPKIPTIVFGTFHSEMDRAEISLRKAGYSVYSIRGGMNDLQRETTTRESKIEAENGRPVAIIVQIQAGGAGLNLQHCSRIVFLSSHWNPAVVDQAIARAYRMGQKEVVEVHHFVLASAAQRNIDRLMANLHGTKREIAVGVHEKLYCDSAIDTTVVMESLDAVAEDFEE